MNISRYENRYSGVDCPSHEATPPEMLLVIELGLKKYMLEQMIKESQQEERKMYVEYKEVCKNSSQMINQRDKIDNLIYNLTGFYADKHILPAQLSLNFEDKENPLLVTTLETHKILKESINVK